MKNNYDIVLRNAVFKDVNDLVIELINTLLNTLLITNYLLYLSDHYGNLFRQFVKGVKYRIEHFVSNDIFDPLV